MLGWHGGMLLHFSISFEHVNKWLIFPYILKQTSPLTEDRRATRESNLWTTVYLYMLHKNIWLCKDFQSHRLSSKDFYALKSTFSQSTLTCTKNYRKWLGRGLYFSMYISNIWSTRNEECLAGKNLQVYFLYLFCFDLAFPPASWPQMNL